MSCIQALGYVLVHRTKRTGLTKLGGGGGVVAVAPCSYKINGAGHVPKMSQFENLNLSENLFH